MMGKRNTYGDIQYSVVKIICVERSFSWYKPYKTRTRRGTGTGFFFDSNGYILTCAHVIRNAMEISFEVEVEGSEKYPAQLVSICPEKDLAVLKSTKYRNKKFLHLGNSDELETDDTTSGATFGHVLGGNLIPTVGEINKVGRHLHTTAPINPGNSGGPLFRTFKGSPKTYLVYGVNYKKRVGRGISSMGLAVPINQFKAIKHKMVSGKNKIVRVPDLIWEYSHTNKTLLNSLNIPTKCSGGYYVKTVFEGSPLKQIGVNQGDIICSINNLQINNNGKLAKTNMNLKNYLYNFSTDDKIPITFWSREKKTLVKDTLQFSDFIPYKIRKRYPTVEDIDYEIIGGMIVMELADNHIGDFFRNDVDLTAQDTSTLLSYTKTKNRLKGALIITSVFPSSDISDILSSGIILKKVNDKNVYDLDDFRSELSNTKSEFIKFETESGTIATLNIKKAIKENVLFSDRLRYKQTNSHKILLKLAGLNDSQTINIIPTTLHPNRSSRKKFILILDPN